MKLMTMESLFLKAGLNYELMEEDKFYDISEKNIKVKSYNHKKNEIEFKKIISLVRKENARVYRLVTKSGDILLKCSGLHRVFNVDLDQYSYISEITTGFALNNKNQKIEFNVEKTEEFEPIVDMQVEDNENYFTNGILSHNTTPGGNALKFFTSIRMELRSVSSDEKDENGDKISKRVKAVIVKNKTFPPFRECEFTIRFGEGIDKIESVILEALNKKIITRSGAWIYLFDEFTFANGLAAARSILQDFGMIEDLKEAIAKMNAGSNIEEIKPIVLRNCPKEIYEGKEKKKTKSKKESTDLVSEEIQIESEEV